MKLNLILAVVAGLTFTHLLPSKRDDLAAIVSRIIALALVVIFLAIEAYYLIT